MPKEFPEFLTVKEASVRAFRCPETIRTWIRCDFLKIVSGGYLRDANGRKYAPGKGGFDPIRYVIQATDLEVCVQKRQGLRPMEPGDRCIEDAPRSDARREANRKRYKAMSPEEREADRQRLREWKARNRETLKRLRAMKRETAKASAGKRKSSGPRERTRRR